MHPSQAKFWPFCGHPTDVLWDYLCSFLADLAFGSTCSDVITCWPIVPSTVGTHWSVCLFPLLDCIGGSTVSTQLLSLYKLLSCSCLWCLLGFRRERIAFSARYAMVEKDQYAVHYSCSVGTVSFKYFFVKWDLLLLQLECQTTAVFKTNLCVLGCITLIYFSCLLLYWTNLLVLAW